MHLGFRHPLTQGIITLEEAMEIAGVIILIATICRSIGTEFPRIGAVLRDIAPAAPDRGARRRAGPRAQ